MISHNSARKRSRGYTLLEIILVLGFIGAILAGVTTFISRQNEARLRQLAADAVAQEIDGLLRFTKESRINFFSPNATTFPGTLPPGVPLTSANANTLRNEPNPLYISGTASGTGILSNQTLIASQGGSLSTGASSVNAGSTSPFFKRVASISPLLSIQNPSANSFPLNWRNTTNRRAFLDNGCNPGVTSAVQVFFQQQYISCTINPLLSTGPLQIDRIDLVNTRGTQDRRNPVADADMGINRVDVYLEYNNIANNPATLHNYFNELMSAFDKKGIKPDVTQGMYLVRKVNNTGTATSAQASSWAFVTKTGASTGAPASGTRLDPNNLISFSEIPSQISRFSANVVYGIRFSFDGTGTFLRSDGTVAAKKLCWNTTTNQPGPCITATDTSANTTALAIRTSDDMGFADLQAENIVLHAPAITTSGATAMEEYYTAPRTSYRRFDNNTLSPCYRDGDNLRCGIGARNPGGDNGSIETRSTAQLGIRSNGAIYVPRAQCPFHPTQPGVRLSPRISVVASSLVSGIPEAAAVGTLPPINARVTGRADPSSIYNQIASNTLSINRLGAAVIQVNTDAASGVTTSNFNNWVVSSVLGVEDITHGRNWQFYNPAWLNVQITTWCSSAPQNYVSFR